MPENNCTQEIKRYLDWNIGGVVWLIGWLFTIGLLRLPFFWKGVLAIILWPYYLGGALAGH